ncbi:MAG: phosphomannomutase/phosphoglucomutase [Deltaproteobacteria bacterium]|nr:MAG: phosphomannomutase/phosphoglucomutase [Deltaproteobacteria bacterium]
MNPHIFRQYDIRGVVDEDLTETIVFDIGRALGTELRDAGGQRIVVGRDGRTSSDRFFEALSSGLREVGVSVVDIGRVPTPVCYFAANFYDDVHGLAMITGSHNPPSHNGLKVGIGTATMSGGAIQNLRARIESEQFASAQAPGTLEARDAIEPYLAYLEENLAFGERRFPVVVDAGNGMGGVTALPMLEAAGFPTTGLYLEPDGTFPHHEADPTVEANLLDLKRSLAESEAELGVAYDGDGDRIGVVAPGGRVIWGDELMVLFARQVLSEIPGAAIVAEVKCSKRLYDEIERLGGRPIMWAAGHSLIKEKMRREGAMLGGEMSGHIFFADRYYGFDDACYATGRLLEILSRTDQSIDTLLADLPLTYSTPELRVECPEALKFEVVAGVTERLAKDREVITVDGARVLYPDGWGLVRASNTQPLLVLRFEAESEARLAEIREEVEGIVRQVRSELESRA